MGGEPSRELWRSEKVMDDEGFVIHLDADWPTELPDCRGVRRGSTHGCAVWVRSR